MKKIFGLIIILFGGLLIGGGVFVQVSGKKISTSKPKVEKIEIVRTDSRGKELVCDDGVVESYIQLNDFTKISFNYPKCVKERQLSYKSKQLTNEDRSLKLDISISSDKPKAYLNTEKTNLLSLSKEDNYADFDYTEIKEMDINGVKYYYFNATYYSVSMFDKSKTLRDEWYIAIPFKNKESNEERIIKVSFRTTDKAINPNAIKSIVSSIKVEENKAEYIHSTEEGEYLVGSIKQNKYESYEHGYILKYKFPKDVPEEASISTDIGEVVFSREDVGKSSFIDISLENGKETVKEKTDSFYKVVTESENKNENYKNFKRTGVKFKNYNNYNMYYFISSYDFYSSETKKYLNTHYTLYCYVEISENNYVKINMSGMGIPITEKDLEKYLNFTVEEY